jgi:propanediol utilization protein
MSITFTPGVTLRTDSGTFSAASTGIVGGSSIHLSETAAAADTTTMTLAVDVSAVKSMAIKASKDCVITVNDDGSPTATITLTANDAIIWVAGNTVQYPTANPLGSTDVATWDVTVAGDEDALVTFAALVDPTP